MFYALLSAALNKTLLPFMFSQTPLSSCLYAINSSFRTNNYGTLCIQIKTEQFILDEISRPYMLLACHFACAFLSLSDFLQAWQLTVHHDYACDFVPTNAPSYPQTYECVGKMMTRSKLPAIHGSPGILSSSWIQTIQKEIEKNMRIDWPLIYGSAHVSV
jgi:hypothetical protein